MSYKQINNIVGWLIFAIASFVYLTTIEPTGSFWDCGEFIACADKLQVGHPPGAPFFIMLARVFILFSMGDIKLIPVMVNAMSALCSAFCILFLFWSITHMARKIVAQGKEDPTGGDLIAIMGAGAIGALAYTFTDSFWFSAVEGEVYATSAVFTAIVFWAILKWEEVADEKHNARWIILIAYMMGLSIGVHLLNLLTIPALALVYYFKRYKFSWGGFFVAIAISVALLGFVQKGIISYYVKIGAYFDLLFVNSFGLPFWSGFIFFNLVVAVLIFFALGYTKKLNKVVANTFVLAFTFILIGYSSYAMIVIRSAANPPLDENDPENVFALISYLGRDQYGDFPLLYGQYYNAPQDANEPIKQGEMQYIRFDGKYKEVGRKQKPNYDSRYCGFFPRMWSGQDNHTSYYKQYHTLNLEGRPTNGENLAFFFDYQLMHMYIRYFMWNFVGRQNDIQSFGGILKGNWESGISFIDAMRLGPQDKLPNSMTSNKGRNHFYFLPLILGLAGFIYQLNRHRNDFIVVGMLFLLTGLAIVLYVNQPPYQPRERDYAYAGSFYAFAIWIGLGVLAVYDFLKNKISAKGAAMASILVCAVVPVVLGKNGWDDHDRSNRYTSRDFATNYLNSCAPNAIIFTNGDNDTFPLWYAQEVEGVRRDVRIVNLSLLNTDWYIDQMKRQAYEGPPVPFTVPREKYIQGTRDYIPYFEQKSISNDYIELKSVFEFITSDDPKTKVQLRDGSFINYLPTKKFKLTVDKQQIIKTGTVAAKDSALIVNEIVWDLNKGYVQKADLMMLDLIANNNWKRPIYYAVTVGSDNYIGLDDYFQLEGLAYRLVPIKTVNKDGQTGRVAVDEMYNNTMTKFAWGNMKMEGIYLDQNNLNMTMNIKNNFSRLAEAKFMEGKYDDCIRVLDKCNEEMPDKTVPYNIMNLRIAELYYRTAIAKGGGMDSLGRPTMDIEKVIQSEKNLLDKGNAMCRRIGEIYLDDLNYYASLRGTSHFATVEREAGQAQAVLNELVRLAKLTGQKDIIKEMEEKAAKANALIQ